jgi:hypothetical protein
MATLFQEGGPRNSQKSENPWGLKWLLAIFLVIALTYVISGFLYYHEVKTGASSDQKIFTLYTFPSSLNISERLSFANTVGGDFLPWPIIVASFILVLILEVILIYRVVVTRKNTSRLSKTLYINLYQFFALIIFVGIYFVGLVSASEILTAQVPAYLASLPEYQQITNGKIITDPQAIDSAIKSSSTRIIIATNPFLLDTALDPNKTFFEAQVIPRYLAYHENDSSNIFKQYNNLPYYFIAPNYLIVQDKDQFTKDLGYNVMRNIVVSEYGNYVMTAAPQFSVLPQAQYQAEYTQAEIKRFQNEIAPIQNLIQGNNDSYNRNVQVLAQAKAELSVSDPAQLASLEQQYPTIQQNILDTNAQAEQSIKQLDGIIAGFSDPNSVNYKKGEITVGVFIPPSEIIINEPVQSVQNQALDDLDELIRVIVHESLHYYAYADGGNSSNPLNNFLYEGFTEYLALKAMGYADKDMVYVSGYPVHVQVMALLAQKIPLSEMEKIDFSQDQNLFESDFKKYFPGADYQAFSNLNNQIDTWWFTGGFGQDNSSYVDDSYILNAKDILKVQ